MFPCKMGRCLYESRYKVKVRQPSGITEVINVLTRAVCARARQKWAKTRRKLEPQVQAEAQWSDEIQPFPLRKKYLP